MRQFILCNLHFSSDKRKVKKKTKLLRILIEMTKSKNFDEEEKIDEFRRRGEISMSLDEEKQMDEYLTNLTTAKNRNQLCR